MLKTIAEYESQPEAPHVPELSGISCPECEMELFWAEMSLVCRNPQMRRIVCHHCDYTSVIAYKG
jgi:hypothetical protein